MLYLFLEICGESYFSPPSYVLQMKEVNDMNREKRELLELPVKQKTVIYLHYVEGYHVREIAAILGITECAVKMRLKRGREQMKLAWKEAYE